MAVKAGLIGLPVSHSWSPRIFRWLGRRLGRPAIYRAFAVRPDLLAHSLYKLRREGYAGLNVTIPHKRSVIPLLDALSPEARAIGAVNVVRFSERGAKGHNTDAAGFADALKSAGFNGKGADAAVFGAGGAAMAVGYALGRSGFRRVRFVSRRPERAKSLSAGLSREFPEAAFSAGRPVPAALWVNATPLGMKGYPDRSPAPKGLVCDLAFDLVYGRRTRFIKEALASGARAMDGVSMLVFQALRSWEFWFGPLREGMRGSLYEELMRQLRWR